ncbi:MAG: hypothetical protein R2705_10440 [Ilumatobacteraceae bacterium]
MRCVASVLRDVRDQLDAPHRSADGARQPRLLSGTDPWELTEWMWASFVDGASG